jgi:REP element-mobilizing transposase RayT
VRELARRGQWTVIELETMPNHVHVLLEKAPWHDLMQIVKALKAYTARQLLARFDWLRGELSSAHFWVRGHHYVCHDDASRSHRARLRPQPTPRGGLAD